MEIKRFFVEKAQTIALGDIVEVCGEEFRHAIKVSRYKVGYTLILSNGDGNDYFATITSIGKESFFCKVARVEKNVNELSKPLVLYLCAIEKTDLAV